MYQDKAPREWANTTRIFLNYMPMTPRDCIHLETEILLNYMDGDAARMHQCNSNVNELWSALLQSDHDNNLTEKS